MVHGEQDQPNWGEYRGALGLMEGVEFVAVTADELPDNVLGYQAVDAVVWLDAQAREVAQGGSGAFKAMQEWVQEGGQLVVCQPGDEQDRGKIAAFADAGMLPVKMKDAEGNWLADFKPVEKPDLQAALLAGSERQHPRQAAPLRDGQELGQDQSEQAAVQDVPSPAEKGRRGR